MAYLGGIDDAMHHLLVNAKKLILRPFLAGILTFTTVLQMAPEYAIFIQKIEKNLGRAKAG